MRTTGRWVMAVAAIGCLLLAPMGASAALHSGPWDSDSPLYGQLDPTNSRDIGTLNHAYSGGIHYFQMNLEANAASSGNFRIYIDISPDGNRADFDYYLSLDGILTVWYEGASGLSTSSLVTSPATFATTNTQILEWAYSGQINNGYFEWWG